MIHGAIIRQLSEADMVLVDLSEHNPNVFFELGVRTSINKPVAVVRSLGTTIPFDTIGMNTPEYDPTLRIWGIKQAIADLADHLRNAVTSCAGENPMWRQFGLSIRAEEPSTDVSPEDARLELLADGIEQLRGEVRLLSRKPVVQSTLFGEWDITQVALTRKAVSKVIGEMARQRGLEVRVRLVPTKGQVHVLVVTKASDATLAGFAQELEEHLSTTSWRLRNLTEAEASWVDGQEYFDV